jgi:hypothetical protein
MPNVPYVTPRKDIKSVMDTPQQQPPQN